MEAQLGTHFANNRTKSHADVVAYQNFGDGGQRRFIVRVCDDGICRVHMSKILQIPNDMHSYVDVGELPGLFALAVSTPDIGTEVVRRARKASLEDSEMEPAKLLEKQPEPLIPVSQFETVAALIQAFHDQYRSEVYAKVLQTCLERVGAVFYAGRREEWFLNEIGVMVYRKVGENETSSGHDAASIRLPSVLPELLG